MEVYAVLRKVGKGKLREIVAQGKDKSTIIEKAREYHRKHPRAKLSFVVKVGRR